MVSVLILFTINKGSKDKARCNDCKAMISGGINTMDLLFFFLARLGFHTDG